MRRALFYTLLLQLFLLSIRLAGIVFFIEGELCAVALAVLAAANSLREPKGLLPKSSAARYAALAAAGYIVIDFINFWLFGDAALAWQKYRVSAVLLITAWAIWLLRDEALLAYRCFWALGAAAVFVSLYTLGYYFLPVRAPLFYTARLSLRADYNMFATVLLSGTAALLSAAPRRRGINAYITLWAAVPLTVAVMICSGSRRALIMLPVVVAAAAATYLFSGDNRRIIDSSIMLLAAFMITGVLAMSISDALKEPEKTFSLERELPKSAETALHERYETISPGGGSLLFKRRIIWDIAIENLNTFSPAELIFGRGGGENIMLYDDVSEPLDRAYPDRAARRGALSAHCMFLADIIDGGVIKLASLSALLLATAAACVKAARGFWRYGMAAALIAGIGAANCLVSNRFGLLYERHFVIAAALAVAMCERLARIKGEKNESPYSNGDIAAQKRRRQDIS